LYIFAINGKLFKITNLKHTRQMKNKGKCITDFQLLEGEQLREIPGFERYKASTEGKIISYANPSKPKLLQPGLDGGGYPVVSLMKDGKRISRKVARLVALTWIPNPENKPCVDHISTIKTDSRACNLRWCTASENALNKITHERLTERLQAMAVERSYTVFTYTKDYKQVSAFTSTSNAASTLGLSQGNISSCCMGSLPTYKGLIWSYDPELTPEKREELEAQNKEKFIKNRISTNKAVEKYRKKPENILKARKKAIDYYYTHQEEIKEKHRQWNAREKQRREEKTKTDVLPSA